MLSNMLFFISSSWVVRGAYWANRTRPKRTHPPSTPLNDGNLRTTTDLDHEIIRIFVPLPKSLPPLVLEISDFRTSVGFEHVHLDPAPLLDMAMSAYVSGKW